MKHTKPIARAAAALLIAGSGQVRALSEDQEAACGAILCLVGGTDVAACAPYLARYLRLGHLAGRPKLRAWPSLEREGVRSETVR
jgi:hypothetical protein